MKTITTIGSFALAASLALGCASTPPPAEEAMPAANAETSKKKEEIPESVAKLIANFNRVHFALDSFDLNEDTKNALADNAKILLANSTVKVEVQGHADEQGTSEYNLSLGEKRAKAVLDYLVRAGAGPQQVQSISYGEEKPAASGSGESAWAQNRRAEFRVLWGTDVATGTTE